MATPDQIKLVRIAQRDRKLTDPAYRVMLLNVAGVRSTTELTNEGVEDVMDVLEGLGFADRVHGAGYWGGKVAARGRFANARMVHKIRSLAESVDRYPLAAMCHNQSDGRVDAPELLTPREAWRLIEAYKAIGAREAGLPTAAVPPPGPPAAEADADDDVPF